ncbi:hypothetical protein CCP4SC76_7810003 [Gammaproteobacteria bacterium]
MHQVLPLFKQVLISADFIKEISVLS